MAHDPSVLALLAKLGRASTPPLKKSSFGITLNGMLKPAETTTPSSILVSTPESFHILPEPATYQFGIPGVLSEQAAEDCVTRMVIDAAAFHSGPWLGTDNGGNKHLADEVFEAGRLIRARGGVVMFLPDPSTTDGPEIARIRSTATVDLSHIPAEDLEEKAPQTGDWQYWATMSKKRGD